MDIPIRNPITRQLVGFMQVELDPNLNIARLRSLPSIARLGGLGAPPFTGLAAAAHYLDSAPRNLVVQLLKMAAETLTSKKG